MPHTSAGLFAGYPTMAAPGVAAMAGRATLSMSNKTTASSTTDGTAFQTASVSFATNTLGLAAIQRTGAADDTTPPTVASDGRTWQSIGSVKISAGLNHRLWFFRSYATGATTDNVDITFALTATTAIWSVIEVVNADPSGTHGSGAIVQSNSGTSAGANVTTVAATLSALENPANAMIVAVMINNAVAITHDADFAELGDDTETSVANALETEWALNQVACDPTFASSTAAWMALEVKAAAA